MTIWILSKGYYAPECYAGHSVLDAYSSLSEAMHAITTEAEKHDRIQRVDNSANNIVCEYMWWTEDSNGDDVCMSICLTKLSIKE